MYFDFSELKDSSNRYTNKKIENNETAMTNDMQYRTNSGKLITIRDYKKDNLDEMIKRDSVLGTEYLLLHENTTWMSRDRSIIESSQIEALCRGMDLRVFKFDLLNKFS